MQGFAQPLGLALGIAGSALHFPAFVGAVVTFSIWNLILFPLLYFFAKKRTSFMTRKQFLRFNFSFFMTNIHFFNLPLACVNVVFGCGARPLEDADLWLGFVVAALYSIVYLFGLDRLGLPPIFNPRTAFSGISYPSLPLYYQIFSWGIMSHCSSVAAPTATARICVVGESFRRTGVARERRACLAVAYAFVRGRFFATRVRTVTIYRFACGV